MIKPEIDIELTSSQHFFENKDYNLWTNDDAPILIGIGIRAPQNIGSLIRLAGNVGCKKLIIVDSEKNHNIQKIKKTATSAFSKIDWQFVDYNNWKEMIPNDYSVIAMETTADSNSIFNFQWPKKIALIVGDERYGIDIDTLDYCNAKIYIPMLGNVKSLNVVQAAAIGLFDFVRFKMLMK